MAGGFTGRSIAQFIAKNMRRPSVTVFALALVLYTGCILLLYTVIDEGADWDSEIFCG